MPNVLERVYIECQSFSYVKRHQLSIQLQLTGLDLSYFQL